MELEDSEGSGIEGAILTGFENLQLDEDLEEPWYENDQVREFTNDIYSGIAYNENGVSTAIHNTLPRAPTCAYAYTNDKLE